MDNYLLPYLLLMAHFVSGAFWIIRINRKLEPAEVKNQWTKFIVYLLLVNLVWSCLVWFESIFPFLGWIILLIASMEWWRTVKILKSRIWLVLVFLLISGGFIGFLYLNKNIILFTYFVVVLFDGSSQVGGQVLGKRPLLPKISPRKTAEGVAAGTVITLATTLLTRKSFSFEWGGLILTACLIMATAFLGDLLASAVKRKAKVATFGKVLPGHGGIIDRFDSLLMAGFVIFLFSQAQKWIG
jgi:phosphatidate cytidylyltransferase